MHEEYTLIPTREEWQKALLHTRPRRGSTGGDVVKTVILLVMVLYCWIPFFLDGCREWQSFFVGAIALFLGIILWAVPLISARLEAQRLAASVHTIHLTVTDEGLGFGQGERYVELSYKELSHRLWGELLMLSTTEGQLLLIPRRCLPEAVWDTICARLAQA